LVKLFYKDIKEEAMDYSATGNYYVLGHLKVITGLSERTLRNYISLGLLKGEKINGMWHFSDEQINEFLTNPSVRPSILAKNNAIIWDFLADCKKKDEKSCIILDIPCGDGRKIAEFFCYEITNGDYKDIRFAFDTQKNAGFRVILSGKADDVQFIINKYRSIEK
jgi:hypothetical protein